MFTAVLFVSAVSEAQGSITPLSVSGCTDGSYVRNPGSNAGLVSDCKALVAVRNHWTGRSDNAGLPSTHPLRTWGSGNSAVGSWAGVSVSGRRVIGVNLIVSRNAGASRISGTLPTQLGDLTRLRNLYLNGNRLTGPIPEDLGDISSLRFLDLGKNNLTGSIPEDLGDLSSLRSLNLSNNRLTGDIPEELGDVTALTVLNLSSNRLTGDIPEELGDITALTVLYLSNNRLTGDIPEELGDITTLKVLNLSNNKLTGDIPEELGDITSLKRLYLNNNKLMGEVPEELGDLVNLTFLHLANNNLKGSIPGELGDLVALTVLNLSNNKLTGEIPEELEDLTALTLLNLSSNRLTGEIPEELEDLTSLRHLNLSNNKLTGEIPEELGDLTALKVLNLSNNKLRGEIPEELEDLTSLQSLSIGSNQLSGSVPEELGDLSPSQGGSLTSLYICRNMLSVTLPADLRSVKGDVSGCAAAPAGLGATAGDGQVTLRWTDPGNASIKGYQYRVCEPGGLNCGAWARMPGSGAGTVSYVADELENDEDYLFQLRAVNGSGPGMSAEVGERPGLPEPPTVDAGSDQTVGEGEAVTLSGSVTGAEGRELTYLWEQSGGTPTVTLSGADTDTAGFTAPEQLVSDAALVFRLTVSDGVDSVADTVTVMVTAGTNDAPTAEAGDDQTVDEGATVTLDGSGSSDPEGEKLTYAWTQSSGTTVTLSSSTAESPTFTAPTQLANDAVFVFYLAAIDPRGLASSADTVTVTVTAGTNDAPTAEAGDDQTVDEGETVTLDGSGSSDPEGEKLTYAWTQSSGTTVTLSSSTAESPTFTVPEQLVENMALVFSLVVTDARGLASTADTVTVTVTAGTNDAPTADAGDGQTVDEGAAVTLSGSATDPENQALTYLWEQTGGTPTVTLSGADTTTASFTAPSQIISNAALVFRLTVSDGVNSVADTVTITVTAGPNDAPTADAGDDQTVDEGETVTLDGSGSSDPEGEVLSYVWWKKSGPTVTLNGSRTKSPTFTAPTQLANDAVFVFYLAAIDPRGLASSADTVTITVTAGLNDAPTADAGDDQTVDEGATVRLSGSATDPENQALTYLWEQTGGTPTVTLSGADTATASFTAPSQIISNAALVFRLTVSDGVNSVADTVTITVTAGPNDAPTADAGDDQTVDEGETVTLDGSGSSDPEGEALTYAWTKTSGPTVTLSSSTAKSPTFTAPTQLASDAVFVFSLVATDARGLASSADTVTVTVKANNAPTANAGDDRTVVRGSSVTLDGSGSSDPDNDPLTYSWRQTSGTTVTLSNANAAKASFPAPSTLGKYEFELTVSDRTRSATDSVVITVIAPAPTITYNTNTFYRRSTSKPSAPSANTGTPSGWSTSNPGPTETEGVYSVSRTQTLRNGAVTSASYGTVDKVADPLPSLKVPPAPTGVKITGTEGDYFYVIWNSVQRATYYRYSYLYTNGEGDPESGRGSTTSTSFTGVFQNGYDGGLSVGVSACNDSGCSTFSSAR